MRRVGSIGLVVFALMLLYAAESAALGAPAEGRSGPAVAMPGMLGASRAVAPDEKQRGVRALDVSPAVFVENKGQWNSKVRYGFDGKGTRVWFTDSGPVFQMLGPSGEKGLDAQAVFSASFVGAKKVAPVGLEQATGRMNYYVGNDPLKWRSDAPSFGKVAYYGIYQGVDLYASGTRSGLKYEFHLTPGASWKGIVVRYDGIEGLSIDEKGALRVKTAAGEMVDEPPVIYQEAPSGRREVKGGFRVVDDVSYAFEITGDIDASLPTIIDPAIAYGSYFGGGGDEPGGGMWIDQSGNIWIGAATTSTNFPTTSGAMQHSPRDVILAKFTASGTLVFATYFGGTGDDQPGGIALDNSNNFWFSGMTNSTDFPVTSSAFQKTLHGGSDGFISKISSSGALAFSSYFGGTADETVDGEVCDASGNCWVVGSTTSTNFTTTGGAFQGANAGGSDLFILKVTSSGSRAFASYLGGSGDDDDPDNTASVAIDSTGDLWIAGSTASTDFPHTSDAFQKTYGGGTYDAFIARCSSSGSLAYCTYLGGETRDQARCVVIDSAGDALVCGGTESNDFPTTPGATAKSPTSWESFIVSVSPWNIEKWARCLGGGGGGCDLSTVAIDSSDGLWLTGSIDATGFPTTSDALQSGYAAGYDAFLAKILPNGHLAYATYLGGTGDDKGCALGVDASNSVWLCGVTNSSDFPASANAFQKTLGGGMDAFIAKFRSNGAFAWATYLGDSGTDGGTSFHNDNVSISPDSAENAWVGMVTDSSALTTTTGVFQTAAQGGWDIYFAKLSAPYINDNSLPHAWVGVAYSATLTPRAGTPPYSWSLKSGSLPAGLSLVGSTGVISGTPTSQGAADFTVMISDSLSAKSTRELSIAVTTLPVINTTSLPDGAVGVEYAQTIDVTEGVEPYADTVRSGSLPAGLSLNSATGAISGTPTAAGTSNFTVRATDSAGGTVTKALSIVIHAGPIINTSSLPADTINVAYNLTLAASGGTGAITWSISAGDFPVGLSLNSSTGVISGTPTDAGTSSFTVTAADTMSATATKALSIVINAALSIATASLPADTINIAYNQTLAATGGTAPRVWSLASGSQPAGLSLVAATGAITGTPTASGTGSFTARVTDHVGATATKALSIVVNAALSITTTAFPAGTVGALYDQTIAMSGGTPPCAGSIVSGSLPAGLSVNGSTGVISGTPTATGTSSFTAKATDSVGATGTKALSIIVHVAPSITTASLPADTVGVAYNQTLSATGGTNPLTWSVSGGGLPGGMSLAGSTGAITGTPFAEGTTSFTAMVTDAVGATATKALSVVVNAGPYITTTSLPADTINIAYSRPLAANYGTSPRTWSVSSGSLPAGLHLNATTGAISGTPTALGTSSFTAKITDKVSATATMALSIVINPVPSITATLPGDTVNIAYSHALTATGGTGALTWSRLAGSLPAGLSLVAATGVVSGTPTATGTSSFTARATDSVGASGTKALSIVVHVTPSITTLSLRAGTAGAAYNRALKSAGGTSPRTWSASGGALPAGLSIVGATGAITGTPSAAGTASFTVMVTDNVGVTATRALSMVINPMLVITTASLPADTIKVAYSQTMAFTGGTPPRTWTVSSGSLPAGLYLNATTGAITGTPTASGTAHFTAKATDKAGATATQALAIVINAAPAITTTTLANGKVSVSYSQTLAEHGGTVPLTWSVKAGNLPSGLSLTPSTGAITGTPTGSGTSRFTAKLTDTCGATASRALSIVVK